MKKTDVVKTEILVIFFEVIFRFAVCNLLFSKGHDWLLHDQRPNQAEWTLALKLASTQ